MEPSTHEVLLQAVLADPSDDLPRLAVADWLEEQGESARALSIRRGLAKPQKERAYRYRKGTWCHWSRRHELDVGEFETSPIGKQWTDWALAGIPHEARVAVRRGFIFWVKLPLAVWMEHGPALVRQQPIELVDIAGRRPYRTPGGWWCWTPDNTGESLASLPESVFEQLRDPVIPAGGWYTEQRAMYALSAACLAWAKATHPTPATSIETPSLD